MTSSSLRRSSTTVRALVGTTSAAARIPAPAPRTVSWTRSQSTSGESVPKNASSRLSEPVMKKVTAQ
jgi:hypothetical protein